MFLIISFPFMVLGKKKGNELDSFTIVPVVKL